MSKPRRRSKRASEAKVDVLFDAVAKLIGGGQTVGACLVCGHLRHEHCGCGQTCRWHGVPVRQPDGREEAALCSCAGFQAAAGDQFCGDGPLGPLLELLGFKR